MELGPGVVAGDHRHWQTPISRDNDRGHRGGCRWVFPIGYQQVNGHLRLLECRPTEGERGLGFPARARSPLSFPR